MTKLKKCKTCNKPVAPSADVCPYCGVKKPGETFLEAIMSKLILIGVIGAIILVVIAVNS